MRDTVNRIQIIRRRTQPVQQLQAKQFRQSPTPAEACLWERLRANRLDRLHFRRQHIIDGFIVDFYCHKAALVVEVDEQRPRCKRDEDEARDEYLAIRGIQSIRFTDSDVLSRIDSVCARISDACKCKFGSSA